MNFFSCSNVRTTPASRATTELCSVGRGEGSTSHCYKAKSEKVRDKSAWETMVPLVFLATAVHAAVASAVGLCDVTMAPFFAKCNNVTDDHAAIQTALNDRSCSTVRVPKGVACVSRALNISAMSGRSLLINGELVLWRDPASWSTTSHNNMFLSATDGDGSWTGSLLSNFTMGGGGRILGGGSRWWSLGATVNRPRLVWIPNGKNLHVADLTLVDSPAWNLGLRGDDIHVERMNIRSGDAMCGGYASAPNTDGFNIGGHRITILDSTVHNGDDCIPVTSGNDGSTTDVHVRNIRCMCGTNGGVRTPPLGPLLEPRHPPHLPLIPSFPILALTP
jgi:polygalacturonase